MLRCEATARDSWNSGLTLSADGARGLSGSEQTYFQKGSCTDIRRTGLVASDAAEVAVLTAVAALHLSCVASIQSHPSLVEAVDLERYIAPCPGVVTASAIFIGLNSKRLFS